MEETRTLPIWRSLAHLRGLAILGVVFNHCFYQTQYYFQQWILSGAAGETPVEHLVLQMRLVVVVQELCRFAVPLFIFLAGHHMVRVAHTWHGIWGRSRRLLLPFLFWSTLAWLWSGLIPVQEAGAWCLDGESYLRRVWSVELFLRKLVQGETLIGYFFTILILQYYVLARWFAPLMKHFPVALLTGGLVLQVAAMAWNHLDLIVCEPYLVQGRNVPGWFFPRFIFYFMLGMWAGTWPGRLKALLLSRRRTIILLGVVSMVLLITESRLAFMLFERKNPYTLFTEAAILPMVDWKVTTALWSVGLLMALLAVGVRWVPRTRALERLGRSAFTIYLVHAPLLVLTYFLLVDPLLLPGRFHWLLVAPLLVLVSIGGPLLVAYLVRRYLPWARGWITGG